MIPSPRQVDASYSENLKLYLSVLEDGRKETPIDMRVSEGRDEFGQERSPWEAYGLRHEAEMRDPKLEIRDGNNGLGVALDALSGRFGRIQAPIGLRDAAAEKGQNEGRQKRLSQNYFTNSHRLSGA